MDGFLLERWGTRPSWTRLPDPVPGPGEVLVQVEATSVGLSVLNVLRGETAADDSSLPVVPGHEFVGRVVEVGPGADTGLLGMRVVAYFYLSCGRCVRCLQGQESLCADIAGWLGQERDGGYAPLVALPEFNAIVIDEAIDPVAATVIPDALATPVHITRRAGITAADRVAVIGAGGGIGIHLVQVARLTGASVVGLDLDDRKLDRLDDLGVRGVRSDDLDALVPGTLWGDGGPTVVVDLVGADATLSWCVDALETGGRLVVVTTYPVTLPLEPRRLVARQLSIMGSRYASRQELREAAEHVSSGRVVPVIGTTVPARDVLEIHDLLEQGRLLGRGAMVW